LIRITTFQIAIFTYQIAFANFAPSNCYIAIDHLYDTATSLVACLPSFIICYLQLIYRMVIFGSYFGFPGEKIVVPNSLRNSSQKLFKFTGA